MSELDKTINDVDQDVSRVNTKAVSQKKGKESRSRFNPIVGLLVILAALVLYQVYSLSNWAFGVPEDSVQADIIALLESTDERLQKYDDEDGAYPDALPAEMPRWLIGYKKTLAGYKISAEIDGVAVELTRKNGEVNLETISPRD